MTHPLTGQRSSREQIAELYDSHAAGLFVYCADQLGDLGSSADVLVSVLSSAPENPPRAALYAFARREILRRDIVFSPPVVDPLVDPASALVERILRELRPQQREVLVLCHVCGLDLAELAWVLDVAPDTAEELALSAAHRFRQILNMALAAAGNDVSKEVADVLGALAVAPLRDVFGRLPWPEPPAALRIALAGSHTAEPAPLFVKPRWPVPPTWPQPPVSADPATMTGLFPRELLKPPSPTRVPAHDATTAPMPKLRDTVAEGPAPASGLAGFEPRAFDLLGRTPFEAFRPRRAAKHGGSRPTPRGAKPGMGEPGASEPRTPVLPPSGDVLDDAPPSSGSAALAAPPPPATGDFLVGQAGAVREAGPLFTPRAAPKEPVYRLPLKPGEKPAGDAPGDDVLVAGARADESPADGTSSGSTSPGSTSSGKPGEAGKAKAGAADLLVTEPRRPRPAGREPAQPASRKPQPPASRKPAQPASRKPQGRKPVPAKPRKKRRERHHDWAWELAGFLICVAIAMIVFFSVPMFIEP